MPIEWMDKKDLITENNIIHFYHEKVNENAINLSK